MPVPLKKISIIVGIVAAVGGTLITSSLSVSEVVLAAGEEERSDTLRTLKNTKHIVNQCDMSENTKIEINDSLDTAIQLLAVNGDVQSAKNIHNTISEEYFPCDTTDPLNVILVASKVITLQEGDLSKSNSEP